MLLQMVAPLLLHFMMSLVSAEQVLPFPLSLAFEAY